MRRENTVGWPRVRDTAQRSKIRFWLKKCKWIPAGKRDCKHRCNIWESCSEQKAQLWHEARDKRLVQVPGHSSWVNAPQLGMGMSRGQLSWVPCSLVQSCWLQEFISRRVLSAMEPAKAEEWEGDFGKWLQTDVWRMKAGFIGNGYTESRETTRAAEVVVDIALKKQLNT